MTSTVWYRPNRKDHFLVYKIERQTALDKCGTVSNYQPQGISREFGG